MTDAPQFKRGQLVFAEGAFVPPLWVGKIVRVWASRWNGRNWRYSLEQDDGTTGEFSESELVAATDDGEDAS